MRADRSGTIVEARGAIERLDHKRTLRRVPLLMRSTSPRPLRACRRSDVAVPEWQTLKWKHRVEGEARRRLKKELRGESVR